MDKNLEQTFTKDDVKMANKPMKRCSTSLSNREIQLKPHWFYHTFKEEIIPIVFKLF